MLTRPCRLGILLLVSAAGVACGGDSGPPPEASSSPQDRFWASVEALCGRAFAGEVTEIGEVDPTAFAGELVMHVRECRGDTIRIPFHVGSDRSRTWVLTRTGEGLRLKHDHRHEDGSEDEVTQYGGDTRQPGTATTQRFPADDYTANLVPEAASNVWTLEIVPGDSFAYQLVREGTGRRLRVVFDLTREVPAPPTPWGW